MIDHVSQEQNKNIAKTVTSASCYYCLTTNESMEMITQSRSEQKVIRENYFSYGQ
jgi:hypothetical protein